MSMLDSGGTKLSKLENIVTLAAQAGTTVMLDGFTLLSSAGAVCDFLTDSI